VHPFLLRLRPQPPCLLQEQRREAILGPQIHPPAAKAKALRRGEGSLGVSARASPTAEMHAAAARDGRREPQPPGGFRWDASRIPVAIGEELDASPRLVPSDFVMGLSDSYWASVSVSNSCSAFKLISL
jgi:hypothetical protein